MGDPGGLALMADGLFDAPPAPAMECPRCGRVFEEPLEVEIGGQRRRIAGHVQGDPVLCVPLPTMAQVIERDARKRRANRRGR